MTAPRVVVVGGGITGLVAADLLQQDPDRRGVPCAVTVLEASERLGGKIRAVDVAGVAVEAGADSLTRRTPQVPELCRRLGLDDQLVPAATGRALVWSRGRLHPLPAGTLLGVPAALPPVLRSPILSAPARLRAAAEPLVARSRLAGDRSVGGLVAERFGPRVVERLVDPLLGGVYAGRPDDLSVEATLPAVAAAARRHRSLLVGLRAPRQERRGPALATLEGGLSTLVAALADRLDDVRLGMAGQRLERAGDGWRVRVADGHLDADAVVVATPAPQAAELLGELAPQRVRAALAGIDYASVGIVILAYPAAVQAALPAASGILVPACEGRLLKAVTLLTTKWPHLAAGDVALIRCSVGRAGDTRFAALGDDGLVDAAHAELAAMLGVATEPVDAAVVRWPGALPQYAVGHLDRVRAARAAVADLPPLVLAGAGYDGVGISACVRQADEAVAQIAARLGRR